MPYHHNYFSLLFEFDLFELLNHLLDLSIENIYNKDYFYFLNNDDESELLREEIRE
jgi:hypothetical protein